MTDSNSPALLSPGLVAELGLRQDIIGEALVKRALRLLWPFLQRVNNGVYLEATFSIVLQWIDDDAVSDSNKQIAHPAGTRGLKTEYPVHALLLHIGAQRTLSEQYLHLCAHVVWIAQTLQEAINSNIAGTGNTSGVAENRREVCRRMRKLSDKALGFLPDIPDSSKHLHQRLKQFSPRGQVRGLNKTCEILERSSAYALALRGSPFRDSYPGAKKRHASIPKQFWERSVDCIDPDDQYADEEAFTIRSEAEPDGMSPQALI
ncbi:MAG: hypothetical protein WD623_02680 [Marinobacter sp.]|uniref:hypothetical protein n=1 Tax=Marinobacter sp. TaxID=50741 RepID=UPI0034A02FAC